ncbi:DNA ligase [Methanocella sp. CWC-04]|uniref:DNA ligase n=1 Tax=Methanooceanicella nereidis TaxID=2052831 RepID=A0AAP2RCU6_9EURY|nr:DNA ligase [Methanocella sp. CWC-04]
MPAKESLERYRKKRDLSATPEPEGDDNKTSKGHIFVIQKHDASNLHYDFRLEVNGVLKSWAVPKGPSTDPDVKRLAMPTEDHPLEYAGFEGVIPEGHYGAGTVMVWDTGTYRNLRHDKENNEISMEDSINKGKIEVWLDGKKLKGGYVIIRTNLGGKESWLLKKMKDDMADPRRDPVSTEPDSAKTGRSLEEIAGEKGDKKE